MIKVTFQEMRYVWLPFLGEVTSFCFILPRKLPRDPETDSRSELFGNKGLNLGNPQNLEKHLKLHKSPEVQGTPKK